VDREWFRLKFNRKGRKGSQSKNNNADMLAWIAFPSPYFASFAVNAFRLPGK
jgi:hypothetical protein